MDFLNATSGETFAAILGKKHRRSQCPDAQVVVGIDTNLAVIRGARIGVAHLLPGFAFILAAIDAALIVLNERVYDVGILAIDVQPDAPGFAAIFVWQTFGEFFPGHATVGGLIDGAFDSATVEAKGSAAALIRGGIKSVRAFRVHSDIADAGVIADFQDLVPSLAAVSGLVHAALRIGSPKMAESSGVNDIGIFRMDDDPADVPGFGEAHVLPSLARIGRLIDAIAPGRTLAIVGLAGADPYHRSEEHTSAL